MKYLLLTICVLAGVFALGTAMGTTYADLAPGLCGLSIVTGLIGAIVANRERR